MLDRILIPLDGSSLAECVLPHGLTLAKAIGAKVTLLQVVEQSITGGRTRSVDPMEWHFSKAEAEAYLAEVAERLRAAGLPTEQVLLEGDAAVRVINHAQTHQVDLIVLSSHGRSGLSGWNVSSVVQKILWRAHLSILLIPAYQPASAELSGLRYQRILAPLDGSQRAECVLALATALAVQHGSQLVLLHIARRPELPRRAPPSTADLALADQLTERNRLEAGLYLEELQSRLPLPVERRVVVSDNVAATIHAFAVQEKVDLVVLSAHGYSGGSRWPYGSLASSFVTYGATPVLIVQDLPPNEIEATAAERAARENSKH
jgi:nucleotide-binding universal stress UspA family protein